MTKKQHSKPYSNELKAILKLRQKSYENNVNLQVVSGQQFAIKKWLWWKVQQDLGWQRKRICDNLPGGVWLFVCLFVCFCFAGQGWESPAFDSWDVDTLKDLQCNCQSIILDDHGIAYRHLFSLFQGSCPPWVQPGSTCTVPPASTLW